MIVEVPSQYESWTAQQKRAFLEPRMLTAHARWQSAVTLGLDCEPHCRAKYEAFQKIYSALETS